MKKAFIWCGNILLQFVLCINLLCAPQKMLITVPFADLRIEPKNMPPKLHGPAFSQDVAGQVSQVLFGEKLITNETDPQTNVQPGWINCYAIEQEIINADKNWQGCPGYVQQDQVTAVQNFPHYNIILQDLWTPVYQERGTSPIPLFSLACGTMLTAKKVDAAWWHISLGEKEIGFIKSSSSMYNLSLEVKESEKELRTKIVDIAKKFLGTPYVWGGRTPESKTAVKAPSYLTGIDCSDFTNIVFKAVGLQIPKNSTSQFYGLPKVIEHGKDLLPGDLLFFSRKNDITTMCHVMLYIGKDDKGNGIIIESNGRGVSSVQEAINNNIKPKEIGVRIIKLIDYIGIDVDQIETGKTMFQKRGYFILMGSYLSSQETIQHLRTKLLGYNF